MTIKKKSYKIALVSMAIVLMLVSTASAARFGNGNVILKTDPCTGFVDFLKFPACGCDCGCDWGCGYDYGSGYFTDHSRHGNNNNH